MLYVVSYDIPDDKRRTKLAKTLKDFGDRVQYSVFECILDGYLLNKMVDRIENIIQNNEDSVRIYGLCADCKTNMQIIGTGKVTEKESIFFL